MTRVTLTAALALLAGACGGSELAPTSPVDATVTVTHGQTAVAGGPGGVALRFDSVSEDTRCPMNAMCVAAGRAAVKATVVGSAGSQPVEIASDPATARTVTADGVRLEWQQLEPYPVAGQPTRPDDYRLTVRVIR